MNRWLKIAAGFGVALIVAGVGVLIWAAAAHKVRPTGDISYGDVAVGVGTLILAVVTLGSVLLGWTALGDTRKELEASQRPVMVPVASNAGVENPARLTDGPSAYRSTDAIQARPTALEGGMLMVPIRNIGAGPALSVTVIVICRNDAGEYSEAWGNRMYDGYLYAAPVGDTIPVLIAIDRLGDSTPSFDLRGCPSSRRNLSGGPPVPSAPVGSVRGV
jgi:hypothetical protein